MKQGVNDIEVEAAKEKNISQESITGPQQLDAQGIGVYYNNTTAGVTATAAILNSSSTEPGYHMNAVTVATNGQPVGKGLEISGSIPGVSAAAASLCVLSTDPAFTPTTQSGAMHLEITRTVQDQQGTNKTSGTFLYQGDLIDGQSPTIGLYIAGYGSAVNCYQQNGVQNYGIYDEVDLNLCPKNPFIMNDVQIPHPEGGSL